jgi:hypothetical protein
MTLIGIKEIVCHCGKKMERLGGVFGSTLVYSTYYCDVCKQAVNVFLKVEIDNPKYPTEY